jgi:pyridoxal phosphate enzyme (YggS family)
MSIENINKIQEEIKRLNSNAKLLVVTKNQSIEKIKDILNAGIKYIGENKWQEFKKKFLNYKNNQIKFHFIGSLQTNKVKEVIKYFDCIQSINSLRLAKKIDSECKKINKIMPVMIEINISYDQNKSGIIPKYLESLIKEINLLKNIKLIGFMTITAQEDQEKTREDFKAMKKIFDQYKDQYNLSELSMGMSNDYKIALEEGATMVRLGSIIFNF